MEITGVLFTALILAFAIEAILEYVFGIWWTPIPEANKPKILMAIGLAFGIAVCLLYKIDLLAELGLPASPIGQIITGALVGRGSEFLHGFYTRVKG